MTYIRAASIRALLILAAVVWVTAVAVTAQSGRARRPAATPAGPVIVGSIKELMDGVIDPTADVIFDAVSYDVTAAGVVEKKPTTHDDWAEIRRHALLLAEATNLLKMPGRRVAPDHPVLERESEKPGPEDLTPEQIQALIDADPAAFQRLAQGLADAALLALKAADAMDVEALFASGDAVDGACESCHVKYWYPKDKKPAMDALSRRKR